MNTFYETLNGCLRRKNLGPAKRYLDGGRRTLRWYVDNFDGRYVTASFAEHDPAAVILEMKDDLPGAENRKIEIVVLQSDFQHTVDEIVSWIDSALLHLASTSPQPSSSLTALNILAERRNDEKV